MKLNRNQIDYFSKNSENNKEKFKIKKKKNNKDNQNKKDSNIYDKRKYLENNE